MINEQIRLSVHKDATPPNMMFPWKAELSCGWSCHEATEGAANAAARAELDRLAWHDAWFIAWVGAANPTATASALAKWSGTFTHLIGTDGAKDHKALQCMAGQLGFLFHQCLGQSEAAMDELEKAVKRYGFGA